MTLPTRLSRRLRSRILVLAVFASTAIFLMLPRHTSAGVDAKINSTGSGIYSQQVMGVCKCEDQNDLVNRRGEVEAAIASLETARYAVQAADTAAKKFSNFDSSKDAHYFDSDIKDAMKAIHDSWNKAAAYEELSFLSDCTQMAGGSSPCLHQAALAREAAYAKFCEEQTGTVNDVKGLATGKNWQERTHLSSLIEHAMEAYEAELSFINEQLDNLSKVCKPNGWSGTISIIYEQKYNNTKPTPGTVTGTETQTNVTRSYATITIVNGTAIGELSAEESFTNVTHKSGETACHESNQRPIMVPFTFDSTSFTRNFGDFYLPASFSVSFNRPGGYTVYGGIGGGKGMTEFSNDAVYSSGDCSHPGLHVHKMTPGANLNGTTAQGTGTGKETDLSLSGSATPTDKKTSVGTGAQTTKVTINWNLRKTKPQSR